jgi:hypothetical protein
MLDAKFAFLPKKRLISLKKWDRQKPAYEG